MSITSDHRVSIERVREAGAPGPWEVRHTWKRYGKRGREMNVMHFATEAEARAEFDHIRRFWCAS